MRKEGMKIFITLLLILAFSMPLFSAGQQGEKDARTFIMVSTAGTGGTYYPMGVGMSTLWNDKLRATDNIVASAQSSGGSVENVNILANREAELAIMQADIGAMAWNGTGPFNSEHKELRSITALWSSQVQFVMRKNKIKTGNILDIEGTSFSLGETGSGIERTALNAMKGVGLSTDDIDETYLGYMESSNGLKDGTIDGATMQGGAPVAAIADIFASPVDVDILEFTEDQVESINEVFNSYFLATIPAGIYPKLDEPRNTLGIANFLAIHEDVPEEIVYKLTKTLFENLDYMIGVHQAAKNITLDSATKGLPVPLHPGAYRYFEEQGIDIPESLKP